MKKYFFLKIIIFLFMLFPAFPALALTISPPVKELGADPGGTVKGIIKLYNENKQETTVYGSTANFTAKLNGDGEPEFSDLSSNVSTRDLASWIKIPTGAINIKPLDWQNIIYEINIPADAEPGGHYAAIFWSPNSEEGKQKGVSVDYKAGSLLLLSVSGDVKQEGKLKELSLVDKKFFYESVPVAVQAVVENTGNVHFRPGGGVEIKNIFGQKTVDLSIINAETGGNVLPQSSRRYEMIWGEKTPEKESKSFWDKVKFQRDNFHFGRYVAVANIGLPQGSSEKLSVSFWIIPWQLLTVVLAGLIIFWFMFRTYNRWIIKRARSGK